MVDNMMSEEAAGMKLLDIAAAFWSTQHLRVAAALGLADAVADGPKTPAEIAARVGAVPALLGRLLRTLASQGIFAEDDQGRFGHSAMSKLLETGHPSATRQLVMHFSHKAIWNAYGDLEHSIRTGENAFAYANRAGFWEYSASDKEFEQLLADCMTAMVEPMVESIAEAYPFGDFSTVVDVGGSNGNLIAQIVRLNPGTEGILFDLPPVVEAAPGKGYITAPDVRDRMSAIGGSAFEAVPQGHRCYIAKSVIHDWDDESSVRILKTICRDAAPDARILLAEYVVLPGNQQDFAKMLDIDMLICNDGEERSESAFRALFAAAGLRLERVIPTTCGMSIMEGVKA